MLFCNEWYSRWSVKRASVSQLPVNIQNSLINTKARTKQQRKECQLLQNTFLQEINHMEGEKCILGWP